MSTNKNSGLPPLLEEWETAGVQMDSFEILADHEATLIIPPQPHNVNAIKSHAGNLIDCCLEAEDRLSYESPDPAKLAAVRALRHQAESMVFGVLNLPDLPPPPLNLLTSAQEAALGRIIQRIGLPAYRQLKQQCNIPIETPITRLSRQQAWVLINYITREDQP